MPTNVQEALMMALVLVAAVAIAFVIPGRVAGVALIGLGILYLADSLNWLAQIAQSNVNPHSLGVSANNILNGQLTASLGGLPGGWIALGAAFCLIVLGIFRLLSSFASPSESESVVPNLVSGPVG